ncbi:hypothetical protein [Solicola sp. PLA-1-18]|uniref:hypothetical protein n=1 Tax=Solicola sp. PLA-1-18 TaxID=3380532 RepID=UPI003B7ACAA4
MTTVMERARRAADPWVPEGTTRAQKVAVAGLVMVLAQLAFRAWAVHGSYFLEDDIQFLSDVARGRDDLAWFFRPHNVHFMPGSFVLVAVLGHAGAFSWATATVQIMAMQSLASLSAWWMLRRLFGSSPWVLLPLGFYLFTPMTFPSIMWYAAAINQLPLHTCLFVAIALHVEYLRTNRLRLALATAAVVVLGLAFYVKAVAIPLVLGLVAVQYFATGSFPRRLVAVLRTYWAGWVVLGTVTAGYLVMYLARRPPSGGSGGDVPFVGLAQAMLVDSFGTSALGLSWQWAVVRDGPRLSTDPSSAVVTVAWLVLVAVVVLLWATRTHALRPLPILGAYLFTSYLIIAGGRAGDFGVDQTGHELRYLSDTAAVAAFVLAAMVLPLRGPTVRNEPRERSRIELRTPRWLLPLGCVVFLVASLVSSVAYARSWHDRNPSKDFITTTLDDLSSADSPPSLIDTAVPDDVLWSANTPYNLPSRMFAPVAGSFTTPDEGNDLSILDAEGHVRTAAVEPSVTGLPGPVEGCGYLVRQAPVTVTLGSRTYDYPFWMSVGYLADADGEVVVTAGARTRRVPVEKGLHTMFLRTEGAFGEVTFSVLRTGTLCVDTVAVGPPKVDPR